MITTQTLGRSPTSHSVSPDSSDPDPIVIYGGGSDDGSDDNTLTADSVTTTAAGGKRPEQVCLRHILCYVVYKAA